METLPDISFRYYFVNQNGQQTSWRSRKGALTADSIQFKDASLGYQAILDSTTRDQRIILLVDPKKVNSAELNTQLVNGRTLILQISKAKPLELERRIDRMSSFHLAERHRQELEHQGQGAAFRSYVCPHCGSTIDVSLLNKTSFIYCRYCESIIKESGFLVTNGEYYRQCDECDWFGYVQGYTEFYFYFLVVIYGFYSKRRHLCDTCANRVFWRALFINFIFILGLIPTLWMKLKGKKGANKDFKELGKGNSLGQKGKLDKAIAQYQTIDGRYYGHPGVTYSKALSYFKAKDSMQGINTLQNSLKSCSNYAPAVRLLNRIQDNKKS